jgi:hypothetical protein
LIEQAIQEEDELDDEINPNIQFDFADLGIPD